VPTDEELFESWRSGDKAAGTLLFDRHFDALYAFFRNTAPNGTDDLVQRTFLACIEGQERIKGSFAGYMYGTARHLLYSEYAKHRKDAAIDFGVTSAHDLAPSPSSMIAAHEHAVLMDTALRMIPLDYQVAVEMRYAQGLTNPRIAELLDLPLGTVASRIRRGLEHLRKRIQVLQGTPGALARKQLDAWCDAAQTDGDDSGDNEPS
jgi:RNA polymerase sigma factor (sigma-70 family)